MSEFRWLFLAGEPLDEPTAKWISEGLGKPVIDNYWQTETGWPMLCLQPGLDLKPIRLGSPGFANFGYRLRVIDEVTGRTPRRTRRACWSSSRRCRRAA